MRPRDFSLQFFTGDYGNSDYDDPGSPGASMAAGPAAGPDGDFFGGDLGPAPCVPRKTCMAPSSPGNDLVTHRGAQQLEVIRAEVAQYSVSAELGERS